MLTQELMVQHQDMSFGVPTDFVSSNLLPPSEPRNQPMDGWASPLNTMSMQTPVVLLQGCGTVATIESTCRLQKKKC